MTYVFLIYMGNAGSPAVHPPSTGRTTPVTADALGLAKNSTV
jgi:hypothetical protein